MCSRPTERLECPNKIVSVAIQMVTAQKTALIAAQVNPRWTQVHSKIHGNRTSLVCPGGPILVPKTLLVHSALRQKFSATPPGTCGGRTPETIPQVFGHLSCPSTPVRPSTPSFENHGTLEMAHLRNHPYTMEP